MLRPMLLTAALTGAFCAIFALSVEMITDLFGWWQLMAVSFTSGALGSLFAQTVMGRRNQVDDEKGEDRP